MQVAPIPFIEQESALTAGVTIKPGQEYGFYTDTTVCIGCKACEVACKQWNQLPADEIEWRGTSYDNSGYLGATTWRHVSFVEEFPADHSEGRWVFMSDVCKHCVHAGCLEACPTGAITRTEYGTVVVQDDVCNGCGYCVPSCPFGVVEISAQDGGAHKCTLCYDRLHGGLEPACAKSCPTDSIRFGPIEQLRAEAEQRVKALQAQGVKEAYLYGADGEIVGGLNAFFLLTDRPEVYNLPAQPHLPSKNIAPAFLTSALAMVGVLAGAFMVFGRHGER